MKRGILVGETGEISILVSISQYYDGPALRIAFDAAEKLRRDYGIHAYVEIDNTTVSNPHGGLINYWTAAIMVNDRIVYIDDGESQMTGEEIEDVITAVLGIADGREGRERLSIRERSIKPQAFPGESILELEAEAIAAY